MRLPSWWPRLGRPTPRDAVSGFVTGLFSIPEGMAYAKIAGFNPVMGIYTGILPTIVGSFFARTVLMVTTLTSAIALSSQSVLAEAGLDPDNRNQLATLVLLTGLVMLLFGLLRLGDATGYVSEIHNKLGQLADAFLHAGSWHAVTVVVSVMTVAVWALCRVVPRLASVAILIAMLAMTVVVGSWGSTSNSPATSRRSRAGCQARCFPTSPLRPTSLSEPSRSRSWRWPRPPVSQRRCPTPTAAVRA